MKRIILGLIAVLLLAHACTTATTGSMSAEEECAQTRGTWRAGLGVCEQSMGGGGGGY
jgi:hypothetical protein